MIIAFITKIGPPPIETLDPPARRRRESNENLPAVIVRGFQGPDISTQQILIAKLALQLLPPPGVALTTLSSGPVFG
jgi:hypothetical protein